MSTRQISLYSLWTRLLLAFGLFLIVILIGYTVIVQTEINRVDQQNLERYVEDRGTERLITVGNLFARTQLDLATFVANDVFRVLLVGVMTGDQGVTSSLGILQDYMNNQLVGGGLFEHIRLVNTSGRVVLSSNIFVAGQRRWAVPPLSDQTQTPAFQTAQDLDILNEDQRLLVFEDDTTAELAIDVIQVVYNDQEVAGYVIGRFDISELLVVELNNEASFAPFLVYLTTLNRQVIAPPDVLERATASAQEGPIGTGALQRTTVTTYIVDDTRQIGFFAPVPETPLVLVVEAPVDYTFAGELQSILDRWPLVTLALIGLMVGIVTLLSASILDPLNRMRGAIRALGRGEFDSLALSVAQQRDEIGQVAQEVLIARDSLRIILDDLQGRIAERARDLQATQTVSRAAVTQRDSAVLMQTVVNLIVEQFPNIYHAQIFLLDGDGVYAVLRASTGEVGRQLIDRGHRLAVGSVSIIGRATEEGRVVIARETVESAVHFRNEFLPETRSELAIPLKIAERVIGALDVQSKLSSSFTDDQVNILQTMADQIAVAIQNTQLYEETIRQLAEIQQANQQATQRNWREYMNANRQAVMVRAAGAVGQGSYDLRFEALRTGQPAIGTPTERNTIPFAVPIELRGALLGVVEWEIPRADYGYEKVLLAQELVNRLAVSLDNARLFQESQRAIQRERVVNEIAARLSGQTDIDEILQTAVREVGQALRVPQVTINLQLSSSDDS